MAIIKKILNLEINDDYIRLVFLRKSHKKVFIDKSIIKEINFDIKNATVEVSKPLNFTLELPQSEEYKGVNINLKTLHKEVHEAESSRR